MSMYTAAQVACLPDQCIYSANGQAGKLSDWADMLKSHVTVADLNGENRTVLFSGAVGRMLTSFTYSHTPS